jgi:Mg/Co/Ni transporter MgtE
LAAVLPVKKAFDLLNDMSETSNVTLDVDELLSEVPTHLIAKLASSVPPHVVAGLAEQLTKNQLKKIIRVATPDLVHTLMTSVPPANLVNIARAMPESVRGLFFGVCVLF